MKKRQAAAVAVMLLAASWVSTAAGADERRIYIAPDDHTDYMWTADEETYRQSFLEMLDYYLALADATRDNPPEHQSRWNCDGSLWAWTYEKNKTPAEFARLIARIRDGHISVPLNALASCYGGQPAEAVLRGMYYAGSLERRFGLRLPLAVAMENQTLPFGLGALWAGAGAKYSWKGICGCLTQIPPNERRPHEIYWWGGADGSRLLMKWNTLFSDNESVGGYAEARKPAEAIDFVDNDARFKAAYPYSVVGLFGQGWDDLQTLSDEFVTVAKAKTTAGRKVIVSNQQDFFEDFAKNYGESLPAFSAAFGNEWDLYSASLAEVSARVRRAVEKLRAAESLAALVGLQRPEFLDGREAARDQAWMDLGLYWEHDWTADGKLLTRQARADWERKLASRVEAYVDTLHRDAAYALGGLIKQDDSRRGGGRPRFYAFNPLGWSRTDAVDVLYAGEAKVHVVDLTTGLEVPSQLVKLPEPGYHQERQCLRVLAKDIPPVGYRVFEVRAGAGQTFAAAAKVEGGAMESPFYRLTVEGRGAITSLVEKGRGPREFAGGGGGPALNDLGPGGGTLAVENAGPVSVTLRASATGPPAHTTRVTLLRESRRIEIRNEITENFRGTHTWSYAFNLKSPDVWHEEVGAVIRAKLAPDGGHYWPTFSRLEWLSLNHFADMSGGDGAGVTLSNSDCAFMKLGESSVSGGTSRLDTGMPKIQVLAGGQIDAPKAGIANQGGDSHFLQRFALRTHGGYDAAEAMRFALEHQNPLVGGWVRGGGPYPERSYSLLTVSNPNLLLWSLKPAEEGMARGLIARFWNLSGKDQDFSLSLATGLAAAQRASHLETDWGGLPVSSGRVSGRLAGSQLQTLRLIPAKGAGR